MRNLLNETRIGLQNEKKNDGRNKDIMEETREI